MEDTLKSGNVYTKQQRIAKLGKLMPDAAFTSLAYYVDLEWMYEAYRKTRKDGSAGVDEVTAEEYEKDLDGNLRGLLDRFKSGSYVAPPVRRVYIPKGEGRVRPIGIPTLEDKILQRAVVMLLTPLYEQDFLDCSYGFRPERSVHQALERMWHKVMETGGCWLLDVDIRNFFGEVKYNHLRDFLKERVRDGVVLRIIGKWLKAGVMEGGIIHFPKEGTPQGGVISPLLSNIYLHKVLDEWFAKEVRPRLQGRAELIRYCDDFVILFEKEQDIDRVREVLPKRLDRYGLSINEEKTRLIDFHSPNGDTEKSETFCFLGFTHFWGISRKGKWVMKRRTAKKKLKESIQRVYHWCKEHRHDPVKEQWKALCRKLLGHYGFYGVTFNSKSLRMYYDQVKRSWRKWLNRRSRNNDMTWDRFNRLLERYPLPRPRIVHGFA